MDRVVFGVVQIDAFDFLVPLGGEVFQTDVKLTVAMEHVVLEVSYVVGARSANQSAPAVFFSVLKESLINVASGDFASETVWLAILALPNIPLYISFALLFDR